MASPLSRSAVLSQPSGAVAVDRQPSQGADGHGLGNAELRSRRAKHRGLTDLGEPVDAFDSSESLVSSGLPVSLHSGPRWHVDCFQG